jgi:hypothetical protein
MIVYHVFMVVVIFICTSILTYGFRGPVGFSRLGFLGGVRRSPRFPSSRAFDEKAIDRFAISENTTPRSLNTCRLLSQVSAVGAVPKTVTDGKEAFRTILKDWERQDSNHSSIPAEDVVNMMKRMEGVCLPQRAEDRSLIDSFIAKYENVSSSDSSAESFPSLLVTLKRIGYLYSGMNPKTKQRICSLFSDITFQKQLHSEQFVDVLSTSVALGLQWKDLNQNTQNILLQQLRNFKNKFRSRNLSVIMFCFGKFGVTIQEFPQIKGIFLEMTRRVLQRFPKTAGKNIGQEVNIENFNSCLLSRLFFKDY